MKTLTVGAGLLAAGWVALAAPGPPAPGRPGVFSTLKTGQPVTLTERAGLYVVTTLDGIDAGTHTVSEVGDDYLCLNDGAGLTVSRIPVTAVRSVVHGRAK